MRMLRGLKDEPADTPERTHTAGGGHMSTADQALVYRLFMGQLRLRGTPVYESVLRNIASAKAIEDVANRHSLPGRATGQPRGRGRLDPVGPHIHDLEAALRGPLTIETPHFRYTLGPGRAAEGSLQTAEQALWKAALQLRTHYVVTLGGEYPPQSQVLHTMWSIMAEATGMHYDRQEKA
jgi:hypothetical protein